MSRRNYSEALTTAPAVYNAVHACPSAGPLRIGVTIATPDYMPMAVEAVRRWKQYSGLEAIILTSEKDVCWWAKYDLATLFSGVQVCFFDADIYFVNQLPVDELWRDDTDLSAVHDPGVVDPLAFPYFDCETFKINPETYFNGGFWACDFANPKITEWMSIARQITLQARQGTFPMWKDFGEQTALNIAAKMTGLSVRLLPADWAFFHWAWRGGVLEHPNRVLGIHAAGYHSAAGKINTLSHLTATYQR